jgi:hypothetical protein
MLDLTTIRYIEKRFGVQFVGCKRNFIDVNSVDYSHAYQTNWVYCFKSKREDWEEDSQCYSIQTFVMNYFNEYIEVAVQYKNNFEVGTCWKSDS